MFMALNIWSVVFSVMSTEVLEASDALISRIDGLYPEGFSEKLLTFYHRRPLSRRVFVKLVTIYQDLYGIIILNCKIHKSKFAGSIKWVHFCTG